MLVVDASRSGDFGTRNRFKRELAAELAAVMSFAATTNNDKVGLLVFTDRVELLIPPRKGRSHVLRMVRDLLVFQPEGTGTDIRLALDTINVLLKRRSIVFVISDFLAEPDSYRRALYATSRRHDVVAFDLDDPLEREIADVGIIALEDAETGQLRWVDTSSGAWRRTFFREGGALRRGETRGLFLGGSRPRECDDGQGLRRRGRRVLQEPTSDGWRRECRRVARGSFPIAQFGTESCCPCSPPRCSPQGFSGRPSRRKIFLSKVRISLSVEPPTLSFGDEVTFTLEVTHPNDHRVVIQRLPTNSSWGQFEVREQSKAQTVVNDDGTKTTTQTITAVTYTAGAPIQTPDILITVTGPDGTVEQTSPPTEGANRRFHTIWPGRGVGGHPAAGRFINAGLG